MKTRFGLSFVFAAVLSSLSGCQRLNDERTVSVPLGTIQAIGYSAPRYEQKLTIQVNSPGAPVTVYLVREEDSNTAQNQLDGSKPPTAPLAGKEKVEEATLEATVPAKTGFVLLIRADKKKAEVKVKVTGR
jgi:hypothetical protein